MSRFFLSENPSSVQTKRGRRPDRFQSGRTAALSFRCVVFRWHFPGVRDRTSGHHVRHFFVLRREGELVLEVVLGHAADARVGPHVFGGLNHVDDRVDRQNDAHEADGGADAAHQGQGQKVAAHGDAGVADGRQDGHEEPGDHAAHGQRNARVLHDEEARDQDEGGAAVHVDGAADRQQEARDGRVDAHVLFRRRDGDGQGRRRGFGEEGDGQGRGHALEDFDGVQAAGREEERQHDEELDEVAADDDRRVFAQGADDDAGRHLRGQLGRKGQDAQGQDPEQGPDQGEEDFLRTVDALEQDIAVFRLRHKGQGQADGGRNEQDGQHVARQEGL